MIFRDKTIKFYIFIIKVFNLTLKKWINELKQYKKTSKNV